MGVLTYTALRNVTGGRTIGLSYDIETAFQVVDDFTKNKGTRTEMLDGGVEYELDSINDIVSVRSDEVVEADLAQWKEFLTSVAGGEAFEIDLTGTVAVPGTVQDCIIESGHGYKPVRSQPGIQSYKFTLIVRII